MDYFLLSNGDFVSADELYHWGIKGMKWGIRRYQNKDGSLTPAGRKRYSNVEPEVNEAEKRHLSEKTRRSKLDHEQTIRELTSYHKTVTDPDFDDTTPAAKKYLALDEEIRNFSGDWYNSRGISKGFKDCVAKYEDLDNACNAKHEPGVLKLRDEVKRAELDAEIKYCRNPDNKLALKNGRIVDQKDWEQAWHKAQNDPRVKEIRAKYDSANRAYQVESGKILNQYESELLGVVLKDLGYKDSPEARRLIDPVVIWD